MIDLQNADCIHVLRKMGDNSIDSLVTDPPAGISFMGKKWDDSKDFIQSMTEVFKECLRVLKPGAHGLVWAIPRTSHWTATALEYAGFEIRDVVTHIFGSGFPKSLNVGKAIDKHFEAKNQTVAGYIWEGWGTALKPASEHWILVRKPLGESTVAKNVLKHGTGGINVDASRIGVSDHDPNHRSMANKKIHTSSFGSGDGARPDKIPDRESQISSQGRFPANLVLSHNEDCDEACTEGCAVKMLDEQSGVLKSGDLLPGHKQTGHGDKYNHRKDAVIQKQYGGDTGGASRFFYVAKASKKDKGADNSHPTVKSTKLMEYLIRLITPPQGIVLDPFMGSGSTGVAAKRLDFSFVGIEKEIEYFNIALSRIGL